MSFGRLAFYCARHAAPRFPPSPPLCVSLSADSSDVGRECEAP